MDGFFSLLGGCGPGPYLSAKHKVWRDVEDGEELQAVNGVLFFQAMAQHQIRRGYAKAGGESLRLEVQEPVVGEGD